MPGDIAERRSRQESGALESTAGGSSTIVAARLRYLHDHYGYFTRAELGEVIPHRDPAEDWPVYDVTVLGLVPHDRDRCGPCQAVGR